MHSSNGFIENKGVTVSIPGFFFDELLPEIEDIGELKVTLFIFWRLSQIEGTFRYLRLSEIEEDQRLIKYFQPGTENVNAAINKALDLAVHRGTLLKAVLSKDESKEDLFFINTEKGQAAVEAIEQGQWRFSDDSRRQIEIDRDEPNIFGLYEQHIGPLTPLIADMLSEAEENYPPKWIEDAFRISVENNVRKWRYIEAILKSWQEEGRDEREDKRDSEKARRRYAEWEKSQSDRN